MFAVTALTEELSAAVKDCLHGVTIDPLEAHECVRKLYTWQNVAERTERVYNLVSTIDEPSLVDRLNGSGLQCCCLVLLTDYLTHLSTTDGLMN